MVRSATPRPSDPGREAPRPPRRPETILSLSNELNWYAKVAELADAPDLGSGSRKALGVRLPPFAPRARPGIRRRRASAGTKTGDLSADEAFAKAESFPMKTEFVDVNETRKNVRVEIPSDVVDAEIDRVARDYSRKARIPGLPARQGAGARHQAALQGADPPRRRARSHPARRRRRAARARRRAGRHAGRPRRDGRRRPAADVHGVVRHGAAVRAGRLLDARAHAAVGARSKTRRSTRRCSGCASARRASSRSKAAASTTATRSSSISSGAIGDAQRAPTRITTSPSSSARRPTRRASTSSCSASRRARPRRSRCTIRPTTPSRSWRTRTSTTR